MSLLQRLRAPFTEASDHDAAQMRARQHFIGSELRDRREEFELDLESVAEALRIKPIYLAAIEQGRTEDLPGPAYALGFVRAYAHYLGLDPEQVVEQYKAESAEAQAKPDLALPVPLGARSIPGAAILLVGAILAGCGYGTWYYLSTGERSRPERVATVPAELKQTLRNAPPVTASPATAPTDAASGRFGSGLVAAPAPAGGAQIPAPPGTPEAATLAPPPVPGLVANPAVAALPGSGDAAARQLPAKPGAPGPVSPPASGKEKPSAVAGTPADTKPVLANVGPAEPAAPEKGLQAEKRSAAANPADAAKSGSRVEIRAVADCWIQVRAADDQSIIFSRVLKAGETYHVPRPGLFLRTGNAGALAIAVDGKPAPAIGGTGTLRRNVSLDPDPLLAGTAVRG